MLVCICVATLLVGDDDPIDIHRKPRFPFLTAVPDFFLSMSKAKHDLVSLMATDCLIENGAFVAFVGTSSPVEVCVVFGNGHEVRLQVRMWRCF